MTYNTARGEVVVGCPDDARGEDGRGEVVLGESLPRIGVRTRRE